jgi:hypothetical protein
MGERKKRERGKGKMWLKEKKIRRKEIKESRERNEERKEGKEVGKE